MKILYIGKERRNAQAVATALRGIARKVTLTWALNLDQCEKYLHENRDVAALVIDAQVHAGNWPPSLKDLRSLQIRPAIVVLVAEGARPKFESLGPPPDGYVTTGQTFLRDLPVAVTSAVSRVRGSQPAAPAASDDTEPQQVLQVTPDRTEDDMRVQVDRTALVDSEQKLANVTAALQEARERHAAAMANALMAHEVAATEQLTQQEREYRLEIALERDKRTTVEEMLAEAASALEEADKRHASALADAAAQTRALEHTRARAADLAERQSHVERELSRTTADRNRLEERLIETEAALDHARHESQLAAADIARLRQHEGELSVQVAELEIVRDNLDRKVIDASRAIMRAGQRESELAGEIDHERAMRSTLEQAVADADAKLREARQRHDAALATAARELAEHKAQSDRELSRTASECDELTGRLNKAELALTQSRHDHGSAVADVARLTQREADLSSQLAHAEGARHIIEGKLSDALQETADARESAARERSAAANRQADLELRLVKEIDSRQSLEAALDETRSAALDAERWFREEAAVLRAQGLEREAYFEGRLAGERLEHENGLAEMRNECERLVQARATADEFVKRLSAELSEATRAIEDTRRESRATIDRLSAEHATALAALGDVIAERDERLKEQAISLRASETMRSELQERLEAVLAAERDEIALVQEKLMATVAALDATRRRREVLQAEDARTSEVHEQRDEIRLNTLLSFEQSTLAALHGDEDGVLVRRVLPETHAAPQQGDNTLPSVASSAFAKLAL
ncbi:MAG TPA: hypothetical protein VFB92_15215 [Vicinamibacterales bacterium]|nr:hypothetical protein [Vicinamibacterales bacterium]